MSYKAKAFGAIAAAISFIFICITICIPMVVTENIYGYIIIESYLINILGGNIFYLILIAFTGIAGPLLAFLPENRSIRSLGVGLSLTGAAVLIYLFSDAIDPEPADLTSQSGLAMLIIESILLILLAIVAIVSIAKQDPTYVPETSDDVEE